MQKDNLHLRLGRVSEADADAIINEINSDLSFSDEVHTSLGPEADEEIISQCLAIGKLDLGEAAVTDAGDLEARWVIHAASMDYDQNCTEGSIIASLRAALNKANEIGARTVALPPIGIARSKVPLKRVAELLLSECIRHGAHDTTIEEGTFFIPTREVMRVFEECLRQI